LQINIFFFYILKKKYFLLLCAGVFQSVASCARAERAEQAGLRFTAMVFGTEIKVISFTYNQISKATKALPLPVFQIAKVFFGAFMLFQARLLGCAIAAEMKARLITVFTNSFSLFEAWRTLKKC